MKGILVRTFSVPESRMQNEEEKFNKEQAWWDLLLHTEKILTDRTNFFLLAQSIFAASFFVLAGQSMEKSVYSLVLSWGGLIISVIWLWLGDKLFRRQGKFRRKVEGFFRFPENNQGFSANQVIAYFIPTIFVAGWALVLVVRYKS